MGWIEASVMAFGSLGWISFGFMALRISGLKSSADEADMTRKAQTKELVKTKDLFLDYKERMIARLKDLENEINDLEREIELCVTPGSRRTILNSLLKKASAARRDSNK